MRQGQPFGCPLFLRKNFPRMMKTESLVLAFLVFVPTAATVALVWGLNRGQWLCRKTSGELAFQRHPALRLGMAMLGFWLIAASPLMFPFMSFRDPNDPSNWILLALSEVLYAPFGVLLLAVAGPRDILLNRDQRAYRWVYGWPLWPHVGTGGWEDFAGVYIKEHRGRASGYFVGLAWKRSAKLNPILGLLDSEAKAKRLAEEMAQTLDLPQIAPPVVPPRLALW